jgi:excisionase family DNA binding protein
MEALLMGDRHEEVPLTIPEVARRLGVSDQVARLALLRGELADFRVGRSWRIFPESVERLKAARRGDAA